MEAEEEPQRRRSARLSPLQTTNQASVEKMAPTDPALVKRSITVRKIAPRKTTVAPAQHDKENTPKRAASEGVQQKKQKLSTPDNVPARNSSSGKKPKKSTMLSPILPSPPAPLTAKNPKVQTPKDQTRNQTPKVQTRNQTPKVQTRNQTPKVQTRNQTPKVQTRNQTPKVQTRNQTPKVQTQNQTPKVQTRNQTPKVQSENQGQTQQPAEDPADAVWSNKVRRSYSRLSDKSFNSPNSRLTLFGFEKLQTPEVMRKGNKSGLEASGSFSALASFTSLLEAEDCTAEPDLNIPGVALVKEKRRRKKVQQIDSNEIDALAAKMNAEFEEAEGFELFVE